MRAIVIDAPGGPEVLRELSLPAPTPGPRQIRIRVIAAGVNRADLLQRRGVYPAPPGVPAEIPGLEYAGLVDEVGPGVTQWEPGDKVMGIVGGGSYAEFVVVDEREALPIPPGLSFVEAGAIPEAFLTAHDALFTLLGLEGGDSLLIHAVGSGVGLAALQLACQAGARVIGTSRSPWKLDGAGEYGLEYGIEVDDPADLPAEILRFTEGEGVDTVLDLVGGAYMPANLEALAPRGRVALVGLVAGRRAELDLGLLLNRRATLIGTVMRSRSLEEKIAVTEAFREGALASFEGGGIRPVVDRVFPFDEVAAAHEYVEDDQNLGKVVLTWEP